MAAVTSVIATPSRRRFEGCGILSPLQKSRQIPTRAGAREAPHLKARREKKDDREEIR
jgi:hypothetical protein